MSLYTILLKIFFIIKQYVFDNTGTYQLGEVHKEKGHTSDNKKPDIHRGLFFIHINYLTMDKNKVFWSRITHFICTLYILTVMIFIEFISSIKIYKHS